MQNWLYGIIIIQILHSLLMHMKCGKDNFYVLKIPADIWRRLDVR